jgi:hypothetical protein
MVIPRANVRPASIRALLERDNVCLEIVRYLLDHSEAADTARGIADWWIKRDVSRTAEALAELQGRGIVRSYPVQDATSVYAFTKNPLLRTTLRQYVRRLTPPPAARPSAPASGRLSAPTSGKR